LALRSLVRFTGMHCGGVKKARFTVLKNPGIPSVLVEVGFLTNRREARLLRSGLFQTRVAIALADAVEDYFKGKMKPPSPEVIMARAQVGKSRGGEVSSKPVVARPSKGKAKVASRVGRPRVSTKRTGTRQRVVHRRWVIHVVRKGDTLWEISRKYGVKIRTILVANGLRKPTIYPGQRLVLPIARITTL